MERNVITSQLFIRNYSCKKKEIPISFLMMIKSFACQLDLNREVPFFNFLFVSITSKFHIHIPITNPINRIAIPLRWRRYFHGKYRRRGGYFPRYVLIRNIFSEYGLQLLR